MLIGLIVSLTKGQLQTTAPYLVSILLLGKVKQNLVAPSSAKAKLKLYAHGIFEHFFDRYIRIY